MKYFIDFQFLEADVPVRFAGLNVPKRLIKPNNTIQPISLGIVSENGSQYYAIFKDFNLSEAWSRYQLDSGSLKDIVVNRNYWLRNNVLKPIFKECVEKDSHWTNKETTLGNWDFTCKNFKYFLNKYGKTNKQIAEEIIGFVTPTNEPHFCVDLNGKKDITYQANKRGGTLPEFYGYHCDYEWVAFCWLFGMMNDLPEGFPKYCIDLKQMFDLKEQDLNNKSAANSVVWNFKDSEDYPKPTNEHHALSDALWNYKLYEFLKTLEN